MWIVTIYFYSILFLCTSVIPKCYSRNASITSEFAFLMAYSSLESILVCLIAAGSVAMLTFLFLMFSHSFYILIRLAKEWPIVCLFTGSTVFLNYSMYLNYIKFVIPSFRSVLLFFVNLFYWLLKNIIWYFLYEFIYFPYHFVTQLTNILIYWKFSFPWKGSLSIYNSICF